jgi:hypothetical protein
LPLNEAIRRFLARFGRTEQSPRPVRGRVDHVIIIDGTMSSLEAGWETNAGLTYKLLCEVQHSRMSIRYEAGVQWQAWRHTIDVIEGRGINRQIRRVYGFLASRYRPGDRIFLFGYSRGAYAVRSLAGVIDQVGLLTAEHATERNVEIAYRHYRRGTHGPAHRAFVRRFCHEEAPVEMVGVWDTVKALGFRAPILWKLAEERHAFHNHALGPPSATASRRSRSTRRGRSTRRCSGPARRTGGAIWSRSGSAARMATWAGSLQASRRRGRCQTSRSSGCSRRPRAAGSTCPRDGGRASPATRTRHRSGSTRGWGKLFVLRKRRIVGADRSETVHPTAARPAAPGRLAWPLAGGWRPGGT